MPAAITLLPVSPSLSSSAWETAPTLILPFTTLGNPRSSVATMLGIMPLPMAGLPDSGASV